MSDGTFWSSVAGLGFLLSGIGGLGRELLDRFAGRSLEAFCRMRRNRERFGAVLDHQDAAIRGSEYLRMIGTVMFLVAGTVAILVDGEWAVSDGSAAGDGPAVGPIVLWAALAGGLIMLIHAWLPAAVTRFASTPLLYHTWPFWRTLSVVMGPLAAPGEAIEALTRRLVGKPEASDEDEEQLEDEIRTIVAAGTREGFFGPGVREMIQGIMALHDDTVGHIMTPRGDVDAIEAATGWDEVFRIVVEAGRTRFPVFEGTLDHVIGVLYVKDLLPILAAGKRPEVPLPRLLRKPWTVPKDRSVEFLLREFLHSRSHMAIVVDEFQQTAGVVTIEDALEEIVGEIVDESDEEEEVTIEVIDEDTVIVDGRVMMDDLNELLGWGLPESEDYETVAGYVLYHTGAIPVEGDRIAIGDAEIEILQASNRKIDSIRLRRTPSEERPVGVGSGDPNPHR